MALLNVYLPNNRKCECKNVMMSYESVPMGAKMNFFKNRKADSGTSQWLVRVLKSPKLCTEDQACLKMFSYGLQR